MITLQAHPEFSTPLGKEVLMRIIVERDAQQAWATEAWVRERAGSVGTEGRAWLRVTRAAVRELWGADVFSS